ncbi:dephospho-CoA kinase [Entomoplasma ellychniae]|uniref:Dephospho-CoA kinase n=1 Tax=Entomoplasma ellychniae TaxID=2114 RepID=A0A8E2UB48_9MOLU|nr:dephospho-CoA kinase [Entomoplasma ellychniae]PPE05070.1 dephospho-CoA kinase [Entomoplasma ellychniae]
MIIGIYGTIGSGKSTFSKRFEKFGFTLLECDKISSEIVNNKNIQKALQKVFPQCFEDNKLQRHELRKLIFNDENERVKLNAIVWPELKNYLIKTVGDKNKNFIIDAALLPELELDIDLYIEIKTCFWTATYRIFKRDKRPKKETLGIYLKQVKALSKFKSIEKIKIKNNFWNKKYKDKQITKLLLPLT